MIVAGNGIIAASAAAFALGLSDFALAEDPGRKPSAEIVVVIDSGVAVDHPAFQGKWLDNDAVGKKLPAPMQRGDGKYWFGWDFVENDATPQDRTGHGTHVAGLLAAELGTAEAPVARLVMFRTGDKHQELSQVAHALEMVSALRSAGWDIPVILCAFDYRKSPADGDAYDRFASALGKLLDSGVLCVCAAGNSGLNLDSPSNNEVQYQAVLRHRNMITVTACSDEGQLLATSNYSGNTVLLASPGLAASSATPDGKMAGLSGSSQAAARVAGRLARQASVPGYRQPGKLREWLLQNVRQHPSLVGRVGSAGFLPAKVD
ncbi:S8 family serine peptidase [Luteolibacter yonseiensis]|uniref:S8 family serine peptidase n=1 Tax=Luteolibacter yonseiensis TaxID=1144680 RepID=A0A934R420_9BACT|nr:S8 family serine peptidase [Luteolibacter yonseiensis]MBK1818013.1 S8 family serine peptidase [Luteolibacter yonseiensis]